ncbi:MAG TPA: CGNR zinc finger domain-containing protein [Symbiobacteriaceae bacterium]|nr:CGNR zinc finger domain-containing protein [Symbiobacteriaceae bacterium]
MDLLWADFINSEWHDWRGQRVPEDRLKSPEWLSAFLQEHGLAAPVPPAPAEMQALKELRACLRSMLARVAAGECLGEADVAALNGLMAAGPVSRQMGVKDGAYRLDLVPLDEGWTRVQAEVAASFARTLSEGEAGRVRICGNADCLWAFYDDTRNRTKKFCDDKLCGNLVKVRRFRAKQKAAQGG